MPSKLIDPLEEVNPPAKVTPAAKVEAAHGTVRSPKSPYWPNVPGSYILKGVIRYTSTKI